MVCNTIGPQTFQAKDALHCIPAKIAVLVTQSAEVGRQLCHSCGIGRDCEEYQTGGNGAGENENLDLSEKEDR